MPALFGNIGTVVNMAQAINGNALGNGAYASQLQAVDASGTSTLIASYNSQLASSAPATLATTVLNNLFVTTAAGVPAANVTALTTALTQAFEAYPTAKGQVISNLSSLLGNLESDANWGPAARAFNSQAGSNYAYSINVANSASGTPTSSSNFTLTTGVETISGQSNVSAIIANGAANGQSFNSGDSITGATNLNVTVSVAAAAPVAATLSSVTNALFNMLAADTINAQLYTNVTNLGSAGGGNILTVTNGDLATTYRVAGETTGGGANNAIVGGVTVGHRTSQLSGTADVAKFSVATAGIATGTTLTGLTTNFARLDASTTGIEAISVATSGTNQIQVFGSTTAATDAKTLTITGNGTNTINAGSLTQVTLIDASTSTGTNTISMLTNLQSAQTIKGGTGTDTVSTTLAGTAAGLTFTGIETLQLGGAAAQVLSFSAQPGITTVRSEHQAASTATVDQVIAADFANLVFRGAGTTATSATTQSFNALTSSASFAGTSDVLAIALNNRGTALTTGTGYETGLLTLSGVETATITVADVSSTGATTIGGITADRMTSLTATSAGHVVLGTITAVGALGTGSLVSLNLSGVTGTTASTLAIATGTTTAATTITASVEGTNITSFGANETTDSVIFTGGTGGDTVTGTAFTGSFIIDGRAGNDVLLGGTGADLITGGEGTDTITGQIGADSIILTETVQVQDIVVINAGITTDTIAGFNRTVTTGTDDLMQFSLGQLELNEAATAGRGIFNGAVSNFTRLNSAADGADVAVAASVVQQLTADGAAGAVNAGNADVFVISGTIASNAALLAAFETGGDFALTINAADDVVGQAFIAVYSDGTNAYVNAVRVNAVAAANTAFGAGELSTVRLATLTGVTTIASGDITAANFAFIA